MTTACARNAGFDHLAEFRCAGDADTRETSANYSFLFCFSFLFLTSRRRLSRTKLASVLITFFIVAFEY